MTMTLISTVTVGAGGSYVTFSSIPQTYKDLCIVISGRGSRAGVTTDDIALQINGSATSYSYRRLTGDGAVAGSDNSASNTAFNFGYFPAATATANTFGNAEVYFPNYTSSVAKSMSSNCVMENNATISWLMSAAGLWNSTAAITSLFIYMGFTTFVQNSTISLYGISTTGATGANAGILGYDFTSGVEGWTGTGATVSATGGILTFSPTANDPNFISPSISMSGAAGRYLNMTFKRNNAGQSSIWDGTIFYATAGHGYDGNYRKTFSEPVWDGQYKTVRLDMHALDAGGTDWATSTITSVRIDFSNASADGAFLVDTIWFD